MECPHGEEVGAPPSIVRCRRGFPGCDCAADWLADPTRAATAETHRVMAWWRDHDAL